MIRIYLQKKVLYSNKITEKEKIQLNMLKTFHKNQVEIKLTFLKYFSGLKIKPSKIQT